MKKTIIVLFLSLFALNAQAGFWDVIGAIADAATSSGSSSSRPDRYDDRHDRYRPRVSCTVRDRGHEEHYGGHRSCGECERKHGHCVETCSADYYSCKAEGRDYRGYTMTIEAKGETRYEAENVAMRRCDRQLSDCRPVSCSPESETVSRRSCR
ncbi:hypothetical protein [Bdellovibrio sp. HCB2-146]|uniref:hypothetical protein n=1 Tax=Bdellovibrio sp. HCB2-146 TaxID=3394362 RepID=UPI0039BD259D